MIGNDISVRFIGEAVKDMGHYQIWEIIYLGNMRKSCKNLKLATLVTFQTLIFQHQLIEKAKKNHFYVLNDFRTIPEVEQLSRGITCEDRVFVENVNFHIIKCYLLEQRYTLGFNDFRIVHMNLCIDLHKCSDALRSLLVMFKYCSSFYVQF